MPQTGDDKIIFLDVGQGDSILIESAQGHNILIDGGPSKEISYKLDQYLPLTNRKIDIMILTHPDPDHLNGLVEVIKRYQVNQIYSNGVYDPDLNYLEWQGVIIEKNIPFSYITHPMQLAIDSRVFVDFLWPRQNYINQSLKDDNIASVVTKFDINGHKFLLTGDLPSEEEGELLATKTDPIAEVLKIAHHGSKYSTSNNFLALVKPSYAVISVGKNSFGHPSFRVLNSLQKINTSPLRTDEKGDIIFFINQSGLRVQTAK
ncbi:MAG: MBL fold metallo-hydrolase [Patescibacteria group bacterium]|nr:MBL fold metallo-hydrolase [Patescibacteria group bacterium]MDD5121064.1 MBL fold metallo-hydrolase [Patescibacteria group bacterium]MDD5221574.1 MBL fold metallo-hydrolase [Patescibacteria group bacterium]MDD5396017.1 MBL fold metallo-hydrolase [Patescibacteria group bacterium]